KVDFPEPEGPIKATYSPRSMSRSIPFKTLTISFPSGKSRVIFRILITKLIGFFQYDYRTQRYLCCYKLKFKIKAKRNFRKAKRKLFYNQQLTINQLEPQNAASAVPFGKKPFPIEKCRCLP